MKVFISFKYKKFKNKIKQSQKTTLFQANIRLSNDVKRAKDSDIPDHELFRC